MTTHLACAEQQEDSKAVKMGRKARLKAKRAAKQRERQAGTDDDDIPAADGFKVLPWVPGVQRQ